jgi:hypothetical protein
MCWQKWDETTLCCPFCFLPRSICLSISVCTLPPAYDPAVMLRSVQNALLLPAAPVYYVSLWQLIRVPPGSRPLTRNWLSSLPMLCRLMYVKGKAISLQAWTGPEGYRSSRLPNFKQSAHEGGKIVRPTHRTPLSYGKYSWYSFLLEAESSQGP